MDKISEFNIVLHGNRLVYYPGEQLYGEVILNLNAPMDMRGLRIECKGKGHCYWSETKGTGDDQHTVSYSDNEEYFKYKVCLFGNMPKQSDTSVTHPAGRIAYPFTFTLPNGLPSSFESFQGYIRYKLKAQIDQPGEPDSKVKFPFTVNEILDINQEIYRRPAGGDAHKEVGCLCCFAGPLDIQASIDRSGYCPGEAILVNAQINNHTTRDMAAMKVKLYQERRYIAKMDSTVDHREITKLKGPAIPKGETATWNNQPFGIPGTAPTIMNSRIMNVTYYLQVEVDIPWSIDLKVKIPITMGTVPFRATYGQQYDFSSQPFEQGNVYAHAPPPPPSLLGYPDMAPPSYAASFGEKDTNIGGDKHTYGNLNYMPVYTFAQPYQGNLPPPTTGVAPPNYPAVDNQQLPSVYPPQGVYPPPSVNPPPSAYPYPCVNPPPDAYPPPGAY